MKSAAHCFLVIALSAVLLNQPILAATNAPLGWVVASKEALVSGVTLARGTSVYAGDVVSTTPNGEAELYFGRTLIDVAANSSIKAQNDSGVRSVDLLKGAISLATGKSEGFRVHSGDFVFAMGSSALSHASVSLMEDGSFIVANYEGTIAAVLDGQTYPIPEGGSYRVEIQKPQETGPTVARSRKRRVLLVYLGVAGAAIGTFAWHELQHEGGSTISPAIP